MLAHVGEVLAEPTHFGGAGASGSPVGAMQAPLKAGLTRSREDLRSWHADVQ